MSKDLSASNLRQAAEAAKMAAPAGEPLGPLTVDASMAPVVADLKADQKRRRAAAVTETAIVAALAKRYPHPEWAFLPQVANGTGSLKTRTADAVAMNLWPSRGNEIIGFEIKTYRGDWLREAAKPAKAEAGMGWCDSIYVVAPAGIVQDGELPMGWGHFEAIPDGEAVKLRLVLAAARKQAPPETLTRNRVAAILRAALGDVPAARIEEARRQGEAVGFAKGYEEAKESDRAVAKRLEAVFAIVSEFEAAAGFKIGIEEWRPEGHAAARGREMRALAAADPAAIRTRMEDLRERARQIQALAEQALATAAVPRGTEER